MAPAPEPSSFNNMSRVLLAGPSHGVEPSMFLNMPPAAPPTSWTQVPKAPARRVMTSVKQLLAQVSRESSKVKAPTLWLPAQTASQAASAQVPDLLGTEAPSHQVPHQPTGHSTRAAFNIRLPRVPAQLAAKPSSQRAQHSRLPHHSKKRSPSPAPLAMHGRKRCTPKRAAYE